MYNLCICLALFILSLPANAQHVALALSIQEANKKGLTTEYLDHRYKNAVHRDPSKAVFKTIIEKDRAISAYVKLMEDMAAFLAVNKFKWDKPTRCYNWIYYDTDGSIDYFFYDFQTKEPETKLTRERSKEFNRLLNLFIKDYKIPLKAKTKFSQRSPATYMSGR